MNIGSKLSKARRHLSSWNTDWEINHEDRPAPPPPPARDWVDKVWVAHVNLLISLERFITETRNLILKWFNHGSIPSMELIPPNSLPSLSLTVTLSKTRSARWCSLVANFYRARRFDRIVQFFLRGGRQVWFGRARKADHCDTTTRPARHFVQIKHWLPGLIKSYLS